MQTAAWVVGDGLRVRHCWRDGTFLWFAPDAQARDRVQLAIAEHFESHAHILAEELLKV
jgi:hypothetical protein